MAERPKEIAAKMAQSGFNCEQWSKLPLRFYRGMKGKLGH
jgi:hypothetical protein